MLEATASRNIETVMLISELDRSLFPFAQVKKKTSQYSLLYLGPTLCLNIYFIFIICLRSRVFGAIFPIQKIVWGLRWDLDMRMGSQLFILTKLWLKEMLFKSAKKIYYTQNNRNELHFWKYKISFFELNSTRAITQNVWDLLIPLFLGTLY